MGFLQSPVDWFNESMSKSGLTQEIVDNAGIYLTPEGYVLPYFDINGNPTGSSQIRRNTTEKSLRYTRYEGLGTPVVPYWPKVAGVDHTALLRDIGRPLWITEGEKKALCLQTQLIRQGRVGDHVVSIPGVTMHKCIWDEIPWCVTVDDKLVQRPVFIVFDWHPDPQQENQMVRRQESKLASILHERGAAPVALRWQADEGEQKIDDWLVAGGDLGKAIKRAVQVFHPKEYDYFNEHYAKYQGRVIRLKDGHVLSTGEFRNLYSHMWHMVETPKAMRKKYYTDEWLDWPHVPVCKEIYFEPVGVGKPYTKFVDGRLNLFDGWGEMEEGDVSPWLRHLEHIFPLESEREWFVQWIAHAVQYPEVQCPTYITIFSHLQGTGKGLLLETLRRIFGKYMVLGSREEWLGRFNDQWQGKLLVVTDDMTLTRNDERNSMREKVKAVVGNEMISFQGKGRDVITTENRLRFIFTGNDSDTAYVDKDDRRAACFFTPDKLNPAAGTAYGEWMRNNEKALLYWAAHIECKFDVKAAAPMNDAKREVIASSLGELGMFAEYLREQDQEVFLAGDLPLLYQNVTGTPYHGGVVHLMRKLKAMGVSGKSYTFKMEGKTVRAVAVKRIEMYDSPDALRAGLKRVKF